MAEYQLKYTGEEIDAALDKARTALQKAPVTSVNGETGDVIINVKDGHDGVSPTIDVSKSGKVTTLTITDAEGTKEVTIMDGDGGDYSLPTASASVLGGVKVGAGLTINSSGVLSATGDGGAAESVDWENVQNKPSAFPAVEHTHNVDDVSGLARVAMTGSYDDLIDKPTGSGDFILPEATREMLGGVKVGNGLSIDSGVLSVNDPVKLWPQDGYEDEMIRDDEGTYISIPGLGDYNIIVFRTGYGELMQTIVGDLGDKLAAGRIHVAYDGTLRMPYVLLVRVNGDTWQPKYIRAYSLDNGTRTGITLSGIYGLYKKSGAT